MNKPRSVPRLGLKFTLVAMAAPALALSVYIFLTDVVVDQLLHSERSAGFWSVREEAALDSFQDYVTAHRLSTRQAMEYEYWTSGGRTMNMVLYLEEYSPENADSRTITCTDGRLSAYILPAEGHYRRLGAGIALITAVVCFFLILIPYIYKLIHRITHLSREMEILAGGDLDYEITSPGRDELADLGRDIEGMRRAVLEQIGRENEAVMANSRLITSLSHDLRTPLTKLTGYLEILRLGKYADQAEHDAYLARAMDNARQMHTLSDEMFRHFQVQPGEVVPYADTSSVSGRQLRQMLADQSRDLQAAGFETAADVDTDAGPVAICEGDLRRVLDNLFSNVTKYADPAQPVRLRLTAGSGGPTLTVTNRILPGADAPSSGIGLPTVRKLLSRSGAELDAREAGDTFLAEIRFRAPDGGEKSLD